MRPYEEILEENQLLRARLAHLLESETIRMFDEVDPKTGRYARNIKRLDTYGVQYKLRAHEREHMEDRPLHGKGEVNCPTAGLAATDTNHATTKDVLNLVQAIDTASHVRLNGGYVIASRKN